VTDEWVEKRVADLVVGDEIRDFGTVIDLDHQWSYCIVRPEWRWITVETDACSLPFHARVAVRPPAEVTVNRSGVGARVYVGDKPVAWFEYGGHGEEYAERLRADHVARRKAFDVRFR
jgi:hypothetical protein